MASWIDPIFDRTQGDVDYAIAKIAEWKRNVTSTRPELKGCFNVSDINRIEGNIQYVSDKLKELYYFHATNVTKVWDVTGIPTASDVARLVDKVSKILSGYFRTLAAPSLPSTLLRYTEVNALEENLYLIKQMLDNMIESFRECGTFECGEIPADESNILAITLDSNLKGNQTYSQIVAARNLGKRIIGISFNPDGTKASYVFSTVVIYPNMVELNGYMRNGVMYSITCTSDNIWSSRVIETVTTTELYSITSEFIRESVYDDWEGVAV